MIKRLVKPAQKKEAEWPDTDETKEGLLFSSRKPLRKLVVMVDAELLPAHPAVTANGQWDACSLLADLLDHVLIRLYRYADDGPPPTVEAVRLPNAPFLPPAYAGWVVATEHEDDPSPVWGVAYTHDGTTISQAGIIGNAIEIAEGDTRTNVDGELDADLARARRKADALAAQVADQGLDVDLYISTRPYLQAVPWLTRGITLCDPAEALTLVSLYLRAQGEFVVANRYTFNRGLYYWVGTRELLPAAWRWFNACDQHSGGVSDDSMMLLAASLLQRVDRALEARDAIHIALNQPQNNDVRDDALSNLDVVLILLMSAVDVAARVAHRVLNLPSATEYQAAWQNKRKKGWLDQVRAIEPPLAAIVDQGTVGDQTLTILRLLRNSVHGAALQGIAFLEGSNRRDQETLIALPPADAAILLAAMDALGGRADWGVNAAAAIPGRTHVDPGILTERLFEHVLALLNDLMDATPVELLAHVSLTPDATRPPTGDTVFETWKRDSIRRQLGL